MPAESAPSVLLALPQSTGGIGRHVRMLADGLVARGHRVSVCGPQPTLDALDLAATGARVVTADLGRRATWGVERHRLRTLARDHDVVHAHGVRVGAQATGVAAPLVVTWHNAPLGGRLRRAAHAALERRSARHSALVLAASRDLAARAEAAGAGDVRLCEIAAPPSSGLDAAGADARRDRAGGLHDPPRVLAIGRLHPQKRLDLLIDVAATWPAGQERPEFLVAGDGPLGERLARRAADRGAPVRFLGPREDVAALLADADVVALPSDWEARPLVAQEALRAGVPLVATDVGGVRDLVGDAAVLIPPGDPTALAQALARVLGDRRLRQQLADAGPTRAATWPTVDEMVDQIAQCYLDLNMTVR